MRFLDREELLEELESNRTVWEKIRHDIEVKDFLFFSLPLIIATLIQIQSETFQQNFILNYDNLKFPNIFTHAYVHKDMSHFINNVGMYLLVIGFIYPLSIIGEYKKEIISSLAGIFLLLPIISALINAPTISSTIQTTQGMSGIVSGLIGLLPFPILAFMKEKTENVDFSYVSLIFLIGASSVIISASRYSLENLKFIPLLLLIGLLASYYHKWSLTELKEGVKTVNDSSIIETTLVVSSLAIFVIAPFWLLEINMGGNTMSNIWGHMTGYVLGFSIASFTSTILEYRTDSHEEESN